MNKSKKVKTKLFSDKDNKTKRVFRNNKSNDPMIKKAVIEVSLNLSKDRKLKIIIYRFYG
jgi:hypothetical protein